MGNRLPRAETEMYSEFTRHTLLRTFFREEEGGEENGVSSLKSFDDLPKEKMELFLKICQLSYKNTVSLNQVMMESEVKEFFTDKNSNKESLGLITVDCMAIKCGLKNSTPFFISPSKSTLQHITYPD